MMLNPPSRDGQSAAYGMLTTLFGAGWLTLHATTKPSTPSWVLWVLVIATAACAYQCFRSLTSRPSRQRGRRPNGGLPGKAPADQALTGLSLKPERDNCCLRLLLQNLGDKAAEYSAQVISFLGPMGQELARQYWTIPPLEAPSPGPWRVLPSQTLVLDFARYVQEAVAESISAGKDGAASSGKDGAAHLLFSALPDPVEARYYNLRSTSDLGEQAFRLTIRVTCTTGRHADYKVAVGIRDGKLACWPVPDPIES